MLAFFVLPILSQVGAFGDIVSLPLTSVLVAKPVGGINLAMMSMKLGDTLRQTVEHRAPSVPGRGLMPWPQAH